ncbi:hybrid sensor histidine kinase/response regulator [Fibrisoma montanum]|uniref:histidine kinase n=1 Tax=Fibrisoma montanum TaxID=2305895 RepID=A0A418LVM2_9BACT|nr:two-component regulator propeller domain-containing protein [Fibrisoma montanum]RIV17290.1 hybrid sensor histidine kinase/response regulator [Fibrisoma montanum]
MRVLYLLLLLPFTLFAQPKGWQELTISDGLSQGMIFDLKQDQKGFMWVATKDGLNRYDGYNFTVFTHDPYNEFSLSDNTCSALLVDHGGRLWIGTLTQGLNLFDAQTQRFYHIDISDRDSPNAGNYEVRFLAEDPDGNIWVNTDQDKLIKITLPEPLKTEFPNQSNFTSQVRFSQLPLQGVKINGMAHHFRFEPDGRAIVGTTYGMYAFNWRHATHIRPVNRPAVEPARWIIVDDASQGDYWFSATVESIHGWYRGVHKTIALPKRYDSVVIRFVGANTVVVATVDYLWIMSPAELMATDGLTARNAFTTMPAGLFSLRAMIQDRTGNLWLGTAGYGLRTFNPRIKQFQTYFLNASVSYLYQDRQQRTYALQFTRYVPLDRRTGRVESIPAFSELKPEQQQRYLMQDRRGNFWVAYHDQLTREYYLMTYSADWKPLKKYPLPPNTGFGYYGNQIIEDRQGRLWIGATNGKLLRFDPLTEVFQTISYGHLLPRSGAETETYALYFDQAGTLWIGTQKGLIRAQNPLTKPVFTLYKNSKTNRRSLSNNFVSCVIDDPNEPARYLWVSTKGGGLERLDKQTRTDGEAGTPDRPPQPNQFTHFTEAQGLPNKVVYGMLADQFGNLWMSTNRGLAQFNPKTLKFRSYTKADGLQDDEFNTGSYFKTASGELLFGGVNGLNAFRPGAVTGKNGPAPSVHIVDLKVNNEPLVVGGADGILTKRIEYIPQLNVAHDQNGLTFEFAVMDYTNAPKNRFRYRLDGIDQNWVEAGTNRFANYAQLPDGTYTLHVMGSADGEVWSKPVELAIRINPPFYRTWWAYLFYLVALTALAWQFYRFQKQRWQLEQRVVFEQQAAGRLAELDALKTQFFANISHEFRTPLTLILGPIEQAVQEYAHDARFPLIQRNAQRLLSLINQLLDLSKLEAGQLRPEPEPGDLAGFFRILASSFTSLAESRKVRFIFVQNESERQALFDRDKLEKIVSNLLSNAFKFTPSGNEVKMTVHYPRLGQSGVLQCTIEDTGIGIAPQYLPYIFERFYQGPVRTVEGQTNHDGGDAAYRPRPYEGTGIGLALVHELVKVIGGSIDVVSTENVGTTFIVTMPVSDVLPARGTASPANANVPAEKSPQISSGMPVLSVPQTDSTEPDGLSSTSENVLLIIDDNDDIRAYVRSVFAADYQIIEAVDGQDGLEKATASLPDIVICDLMMPRLDGFGFCRALKTGEATSHIPVVMLTAKATVEDRIEGFDLGADDYLTKPFYRAEIQARVRNLVSQRQRLFQRFAARATPQTTPAPTETRAVAGQPEPAKPALLAAEQKFLDRLKAVVLQHLDNTEFTVETLAEAVNMSRAQLHRKLRAVANTTPTDFIRHIRLAHAAQLLQAGDQSVTQVAYAVGFDNLSYFAKVFQERYGVLPSQWGKESASSA